MAKEQTSLRGYGPQCRQTFVASGTLPADYTIAQLEAVLQNVIDDYPTYRYLNHSLEIYQYPLTLANRIQYTAIAATQDGALNNAFASIPSGRKIIEIVVTVDAGSWYASLITVPADEAKLMVVLQSLDETT